MALRMIAYRSPFEYVYFFIDSESPVGISASSYEAPSHDDQEVADNPVFYSTNRTIARRWCWYSMGFGLYDQPMEVKDATYEYVLMRSPAGAMWAYGLNDDGTWYLEAFDSGVPKNRRVVTTVMHKGKLLWVADPRQKPPTGGV